MTSGIFGSGVRNVRVEFRWFFIGGRYFGGFRWEIRVEERFS